MSIDIVLAQFGRRAHIVNPIFDSVKQYFSNPKVVLYTDSNIKLEDVDVKVVNPPFDKNHYRYGNHCNDYYKLFGLAQSTSEIAIAFDSDMLIVSNKVEALLTLTKRFGMCFPMNPRLTVANDTLNGENSDKKLDDSMGLGMALNMTPISMHTSNENARALIEAYLELMLKNPIRGPVNAWRAMMRVGWSPLMLPPQWCVCQEYVGIDDPIILHIGHPKVQQWWAK